MSQVDWKLHSACRKLSHISINSTSIVPKNFSLNTQLFWIWMCLKCLNVAFFIHLCLFHTIFKLDSLFIFIISMGNNHPISFIEVIVMPTIAKNSTNTEMIIIDLYGWINEMQSIVYLLLSPFIFFSNIRLFSF